MAGPTGGAGEASTGGIVRRGPGVPRGTATQPTAEEVWRSGLPPGTPRGRRGWRRAAGIASTVFTVALLVASCVVIYLRLHHPPLRVTGVSITRQASSGCTTDVTARLSTNGGAGAISYEWLSTARPSGAGRLTASVSAGQATVYVTEILEGQGHGTLRQTVTVRVLGPGSGSASAAVDMSC